MMPNYPLTRCPKCHKAFRQELHDASRSLSELSLVTCPFCGHSFPRFPIEAPSHSTKPDRPSDR